MFGREGVFFVYLQADRNVVHVSLNYDHWDLPDEYVLATGTSFWKKVEATILDTFPGSETHDWPSYDHEVISFRMGCVQDSRKKTYKDVLQKSSPDISESLKKTLEEKARLEWLRPGVPTLFKLTTKFLTRNKKNLVASVMEFQRHHGYDSTKLFLEQFENALLYG